MSCNNTRSILNFKVVSGDILSRTLTFKNEDFDLTNINERMATLTKLSYLSEHLELIDDQNWDHSSSFFIRIFSFLIYYIPWILLPFVTIPINMAMYYISPHEHVRHV